MARASNRQSDPGSARPRRPTSTRVHGSILALSGLGIVLTAYLSFVKWTSVPLAACGAGSGCDLVQQSRWATLLGLPIAFWGLLSYLLIAVLSWQMRRRPARWRLAWTTASIALAVSVYLTAVSRIELQASCVYCLASLAIISAIFVLLTLARPPRPDLAWRVWAPVACLLAGTVLGILHLHYSGVFDPAAGPEKPFLKQLAIHLRDSGAQFYGAYWCPHCKEQKRIFEASADRLPYIECSPHGRKGPRATVCKMEKIDSYPTWIINGRRYTHVLTAEALARYSGFDGKRSNAGGAASAAGRTNP